MRFFNLNFSDFEMSKNIEMISAEVNSIKTFVNSSITTRNIKNRIQEVENKLDDILNDNSGLLAEEKDKDSEISTIKAQLRDKNLKIRDVEINLLEEQAKNKAKDDKINKEQMNSRELKVKNEILYDQLHGKRKVVADLTSQIQVQNFTIKMLKGDKTKIYGDAKIEESNPEDIDDSKDEMIDKLEEKNTRIHKLEKKLQDSKRANTELIAALKSTNSNFCNLWNKLVERDDEVDKITKGLQQVKKENSHLKSLVVAKNSTLIKTEMKLETMKCKILNVNSQLNDILYPDSGNAIQNSQVHILKN